MSHFRRAYVPGGSFFFTVVTERRAPILCTDTARLGWIKKEFTKAYLAAGGNEQARSDSRIRQRRRGVLQRRFWEHALRDEEDYARHFDYIHYNPVKHGHVESVQDWPYSTFHRWVKQGVYPADWGSKAHGIMEFDDLDTSAME